MTAASLRLRAAPAARTDPVVEAYSGGDPFLVERLGGSFLSQDDIRRTCDAFGERSFDRERLVASLLRFNGACENLPGAEAHIRALLARDTLLVVTGQQPGFFGGPLYSVYKAASAVAVARAWASRLGRTLVPMFWIASDDHDIAEIDGVGVQGPDLGVRRIRAQIPQTGLPIADLVIDESAVSAFAEAAELADAEKAGGAPTSEAIRSFAPRVGERWSVWFGRCLARLLGETGIVLFEPSECRDVVLPSLKREFEAPEHTPRALRAGALALESKGVAAPLPTDSPSGLFLVRDGRRSRFDPAVDAVASFEQAISSSRASWSADAGLRPVIQSTCMPAALVVGGPGELRYWLQIQEVFRSHGVPMPVFFPRFSATIVTPAVRRAAEALELSDADLFVGEAELLSRIRSHPVAGFDSWNALAQETLRSFDVLGSSVAALGGAMQSRVDTARSGLSNSLDRLLSAATQRVREAEGNHEKRARLVARSILPAGKPQERVLSPLPFASRHGLDLFGQLAASIDPSEHRHQFLDIGS